MAYPGAQSVKKHEKVSEGLQPLRLLFVSAGFSGVGGVIDFACKNNSLQLRMAFGLAEVASAQK